MNGTGSGSSSGSELNPYARSSSTRPQREKKKGSAATVVKEPVFDVEKDIFFDSTASLASNDAPLDDRINPVGPIDDDDLLQGAGIDGAPGGIPQTYRGMIKVALESMNGESTFESISKYIGTRFKDQLINKAETWKHSIAGCLSVYFARKEQKDPSGKVIWTLGEPPKPKRRGRKRERDEPSTIAERDVLPIHTQAHPPIAHSNSRGSNDYVVPHVAKKKKQEMVLVSADTLESLEEENQCLKLIVAKRQREERMMDFHVSNSNINASAPTIKTRQSTSGNINDNISCVSCNERKELWMMINPCGHLFCGSIFCDASTAKRCAICGVHITGRLPFRGNRSASSTSSSTKSPGKLSANSLSTHPISPSASSSHSNLISGSSNIVSPSSSLSSLSCLVSVIDDKKMGDLFGSNSSKFNELTVVEMDTKE